MRSWQAILAFNLCFALAYALIGCGGGGGKSSKGSTAPSSTPEPGTITDKSTVISQTGVAVAKLGTSDSGDEPCGELKFEVTKNGKAVADIKLEFSYTIGGKSASDTSGTLEPANGTTGADGMVTTKYCAGTAEGKVVVSAKSGKVSANAAAIDVSTVSLYKFAYSRTDLTAPKATDKLISLNVFESTADDCTFLYFSLTAKGKGMASQTLEFRTPPNYPKGFKLAEKAGTALSKTDPSTGRKYLYYAATSDAKGVFKVPVCSGTELGTSVVSATYTAPDGGIYPTSSPILKVVSGLTSYGSFSIQFAPTDIRSIVGNFSSNLTTEKTLTIQTGTVQNGFPIDNFSVNVASEYGYSETVGSATPAANGQVQFKLNQTHLSMSRPFEYYRYSDSLSRTRCDVESLSLNSSINGTASTADILYTDLRKNWRSTVIYYTQGSEQYLDANNNGRYDTGGDGFWDKNQNGVFDSGDAITYDANSNGNIDGEWFIDLPSPFVDVDENGIYESSKDILVGDEYQAANGKWDVSTQIWRYRVFPLDMGNSVYSMKHGQIKHNNFADQASDTIGSSYFTDLNTRGYSPPDNDATAAYGPPQLWGSSAYTVSGTPGAQKWFYFHAQDVCGNPISGGSNIAVNFETVTGAEWGSRDPLAHFYVQPSDETREASRHLLTNAIGSSTAKLNFDVVDHPAHASSYPIVFFSRSPNV